jgi:WD40 repeat protein
MTEAFVGWRSPQYRHPPFDISRQMKPDETDNTDIYDDFGGQRIGDAASEPIAAAAELKTAIAAVQQSQIQTQAMLGKNWRTGNWQVRGFSLDSSYEDEDEEQTPDRSDSTTNTINTLQKTCVAIIEADPHEPTLIWVGRTDGSLVQVQLGTVYWTNFQSETDKGFDNGFSTMNADKRQTSSETPFEILWQRSAVFGTTKQHQQQPVCSILLPTDSSYMFTAHQGSGDVQQWTLNDDGIGAVPLRTLTDAHAISSTNTIVCLKAVSKNVAEMDESILLSVSQNGGLAFWDIESGDLLRTCQIIVPTDTSDEPTTIHSADSDGNWVCVGTADGHVLIYSVSELLKGTKATDGGGVSCPLPNGQWLASKEAYSVTDIACAGEGTLGRGSSQSTMLLLTGGSDGSVKQWEVLSRETKANDGRVQLEQWPKLSTQRLPKKAHVFKGHDGSITALKPIDATKFLSASLDGTIQAWNPSTGKELFRIDGFEDPINSLCLQDNMLITGGMKQFVCVHDFGKALGDDDDYDLEMPEYDQRPPSA